jgi:hypothetical protein
MENPREGRRDAIGDLVTGIVMLAVVAVGSWSLWHNAELTELDYGADPGPGLLPEILLALLGVLAAAMVLWALFRLRAGPRLPAGEPRRPLPWFPFLLVGVLVVYSQVMALFGFIPTTLAVTALFLVSIHAQEHGRPGWRALAVGAVEAVAITLATWVVFEKFIHIPLP